VSLRSTRGSAAPCAGATVPSGAVCLRDTSSRATVPTCRSRSISGPEASGGTSATTRPANCPASSFFKSDSTIRPFASSIALIAAERAFSTSSASRPMFTCSVSDSSAAVRMSRSVRVTFSVESDTRLL
jgi:hypothetical protein